MLASPLNCEPLKFTSSFLPEKWIITLAFSVFADLSLWCTAYQRSHFSQTLERLLTTAESFLHSEKERRRWENGFLKPFRWSPVSKSRIQIQCRATLWVVWCHRRSHIFIVEFSLLSFRPRWPVIFPTQPSKWPPTGVNGSWGAVFTLRLQSPACFTPVSHLLPKLSPTFHQPVTSPTTPPPRCPKSHLSPGLDNPALLALLHPSTLLWLKHDF